MRKWFLVVTRKFYSILRKVSYVNYISLGVTGNVSINDNGDRSADYALLDMDPETSKFRVSEKVSKLRSFPS